jgi:imidazolonepropionase-like amidohydrolase
VPHRYPALIASPPAGEGRLWLTNALLFDGTGADVRDAAAILVEDGVIGRVASATDPCPSGARLIDLEGRMVMPGLIDAHTHAAGHVPAPLKGAEEVLPGTAAHFLQAELGAILRQGITTIRVVGSQGIRPQEARQAMRYGAFRGPRLLTCGKIVSATAPGGRFYGDMYREADGPDDVRRAVREQIRAGADFIKVMTTGARSNELEDPEPVQLTDEEFAALVEEAHRMGFKVAAHAEGLAGCEAAISHGMDTIEHGMYLHQKPALLEQMAATGQVLVPTLSGYYWMAGMGEVVDPSDAVLDPEMPPVLVELANHNLEQGVLTMRAAAQAGVTIALGSDAHTAGLEIVRMVHHGLPPTAALLAATKGAASALGLSEYIGTVQEGMLADLVVVEGDVVAEPGILCDVRRIWLVVQLGALVAGQGLERTLG